MPNFFKSLALDLGRALAGVAWPERCVCCGVPLEAGESFCADCGATLKPIEPPYCDICSRPLPEKEKEYLPVCGHCLAERPEYDHARPWGDYGGALGEAIRDFKFRGRAHAVHAFEALIMEAFSRIEHEVDAVVPVPLHPSRLRERGFNQSAELAKIVAGRRRLPLLLGALRRDRKTSPQYGLSRPARLKNVKGAFSTPNPAKIEGRRLVLVDDVITTGSTVNECARVLKRSGARSVSVVSLAAVFTPGRNPLP